MQAVNCVLRPLHSTSFAANSEIPTEARAQLIACPEQPRFHCIRISANDGPDLCQRKIFVLEKNQRLSLQWRQTRYRSSNFRGQLGIEHSLRRPMIFGYAELVGKIINRRLATEILISPDGLVPRGGIKIRP